MAQNTAEAPVQRTRPRDRKARIVKSATKLFARHGVQNVTMADIAERNEMTAGGLYRHWPSKHALFEAVIDNWLNAASHTVDMLELPLREFVAARLEAGLADGDLLIARDGWRLSNHLTQRIAMQADAERVAHTRSLLADRPELSEDAADLLSRAISMITRSLNMPRPPSDKSHRVALLLGAAQKVAQTDLTLNNTSAASGPPAGTSLGLVTKRENILLVAGQLFGMRGYRAVTIHDIATAAGVSRPTLYGIFSSKEAVILDIVDRSYHCYWADLHAAVTTSTEPYEALAKVMRSYVLLSANQPHIAAFIETEGGFNDQIVARRGEYINEVARLLVLSRDDLTLVDADGLIRTVLPLINGFASSDAIRTRADFVDAVFTIVMAVLAS